MVHSQLKRSVSLLPCVFLMASSTVICCASPGYSQNLLGAATCDNENDGATLNATVGAPFPYVFIVSIDVNATFIPEGTGRPIFKFPIGLAKTLVNRVVTRAGAQQGVGIAGRYEYGGIAPTGAIVLGPGTLSEFVGCFPAPKPGSAGGGSGSGGSGGGSCTTGYCGASSKIVDPKLIADRGVLNFDPAPMLQTSAQVLASESPKIGSWQGKPWQGESVN